MKLYTSDFMCSGRGGGLLLVGGILLSNIVVNTIGGVTELTELQYCAKVMRAILVEFRRILAMFSKNGRYFEQNKTSMIF